MEKHTGLKENVELVIAQLLTAQNVVMIIQDV